MCGLRVSSDRLPSEFTQAVVHCSVIKFNGATLTDHFVVVRPEQVDPDGQRYRDAAGEDHSAVGVSRASERYRAAQELALRNPGRLRGAEALVSDHKQCCHSYVSRG